MADQVVSMLGVAAAAGEELVEEGPIGRRVTRQFDHAGTRFVLVFEPFEANGPLRVAGIYIR